MTQEAPTISHARAASAQAGHLQHSLNSHLSLQPALPRISSTSVARTRGIKAREVFFTVILSMVKGTQKRCLVYISSRGRERGEVVTLHACNGNTKGRHLITFAKTEVLKKPKQTEKKNVFQVWKACHTHRYCGINNALSNLQPWLGSSRSKPTKQTCTAKRKEKGRQREKGTDQQRQRTRAAAQLSPTLPLGR